VSEEGQVGAAGGKNKERVEEEGEIWEEGEVT
jgi:hypothetical protein